MVRIIFVDLDYEEIETECLNMTIEEALKVLPNLGYRVGTDRLIYEKSGVIIVDIKEKSIEIQLNFPANK